MRLLLDECVAKASAIRLRMVGHDVLRVGTEIRIPSDTDILRFATREERLLITHDQDFGELVFKRRLKAPTGVVLFRYEPSHPEEVARRMILIMASGMHRFEHALTVVDESRVRQRRIR